MRDLKEAERGGEIRAAGFIEEVGERIGIVCDEMPSGATYEQRRRRAASDQHEYASFRSSIPLRKVTPVEFRSISEGSRCRF